MPGAEEACCWQEPGRGSATGGRQRHAEGRAQGRGQWLDLLGSERVGVELCGWRQEGALDMSTAVRRKHQHKRGEMEVRNQNMALKLTDWLVGWGGGRASCKDAVNLGNWAKRCTRRS